MASVNLTSSRTGTFYFAFGSNLSPYQMSQRCISSPTSSTPVAVARLDGYKWIICQRGYPNVVPCSASDGLEDKVVWGIVYNMSAADVEILDHYEGHTSSRNPRPVANDHPDPVQRQRRPFLQGNWDYNKMYLPVRVMKWLVDEPMKRFGLDATSLVQEHEPNGANADGDVPNGEMAHSTSSRSREATSKATVTALVYVDELRLRPGTIYPAYVGRMNRGIDESVALGLPSSWIEKVLRRWVTPGVYPPKGYIGTNEGYVPDAETEASEKVLERGVSGEN